MVQQQLFEKKIYKSKKIRNDLLGWVHPEQIKEALEYGAITLKNGVYFVAVEQQIIGVENGKSLREHRKQMVISKKYYEFKEKLDGRKINN